MKIPKRITDLAAEALTPRNDGWAQKGACDDLRQLRGSQPREVQDYIDKVLRKAGK